MLEKRTKDAWYLAKDLLGSVNSVIHQPYGHAGITFELRSDSGEYILKTKSPTGAFDHTERHINVISAMGIRTPTILRRGSHANFDYLLLTKVPGIDLGHALGKMTPDQMTRLASEIVQIERQVMSLPKGTGFGWTPMDVAGPFDNWFDVVERDSQNAPEFVRAEVLEWRSYLQNVEPTCFLDDLTVKNVIVENGELQGIVDLDGVCYGDPLYWLSLAEVTSILDVGLDTVFYGNELRRHWGMSEETSAICDLYNVIQAWFFLIKDSDLKILENWSTERLHRVYSFREKR